MPSDPLEHPRVVALLAGLVRTFRAGDIKMRFDEADRVILRRLGDEGLVDLANDGFRLNEAGGSYAVRSQVPPVTPKGILFLERLPIDQYIDRPGLFRFLGWL